MRVDLYIYSGRPNPTWNLTQEQRQTFLKLIKTLQSCDEAKYLAPALGYQGIAVSDFIKCCDYHVYRGNVDVDCWRLGKKFYSDPERSVEKWLLSTMPANTITEGALQRLLEGSTNA